MTTPDTYPWVMFTQHLFPYTHEEIEREFAESSEAVMECENVETGAPRTIYLLTSFDGINYWAWEKESKMFGMWTLRRPNTPEEINPPCQCPYCTDRRNRGLSPAPPEVDDEFDEDDFNQDFDLDEDNDEYDPNEGKYPDREWDDDWEVPGA